jgi:hypothetical protein
MGPVTEDLASGTPMVITLLHDRAMARSKRQERVTDTGKRCSSALPRSFARRPPQLLAPLSKTIRTKALV